VTTCQRLLFNNQPTSLATGTYTGAYKVCTTISAKRRITTGCPLPAHRRLPSFSAPRLISLPVSTCAAPLSLRGLGATSATRRYHFRADPKRGEPALRFRQRANRHKPRTTGIKPWRRSYPQVTPQLNPNKPMSQTKQRLRKFARDPQYASRYPGKRLTATSVAILSAVERYRLIPTSLILRLVPGNDRVIYRHLQYLYHAALINRLALFGKTGRPGEFNYFLDNPQTLELLVSEAGVAPEALDFDAVKRNKDKWRPLAVGAGERTTAAVELEETSEAQRYFLKHELMISRFHGMLELACQRSARKVRLVTWSQGPKLFHSVEAPKLQYTGATLKESDENEVLPHRPDAFFSLSLSETGDTLHFLYEAERGTNTTTRVIKKLRSHFYYITKKRQIREHYGIRRIRAVLIETLSTDWAERLRAAAKSPAISGQKPSELFWFTSSEFFAKRIETPVATGRTRRIPYYLQHPEVIFNNLWFSPLDAVGALPRSIIPTSTANVTLR
jgi:hypothetical protein